MQHSLSYFYQHPKDAVNAIIIRFGGWLPDKLYLKMKFRWAMGYPLNLKHPRTFSEKLQWLKLYDHNPNYVKMVDKIEVKDYVAGIIGKEYIIPTLGVWKRAEDIDWDSLPNQFVLKCNHDSGGLVICRDKSKLDKEAVIKKINKTLKTDFYKIGREWPYKNVQRRILAEKYIDPDPGTNDLPDYKFFCFNGEPCFCQVITGRSHNMCIDFFDKNWEHQSFHEPRIYPFADVEPLKPLHFVQMWDAAKELAKGTPFSRIDFYDTNNHVYFGEITFFPTSGMGGFDPMEWDEVFGNMIDLIQH